MKSKSKFLLVFAVSAGGMLTSMGSHAQYYGYSGPGTTMRSGVPMNPYARAPMVQPMVDPTTTWQYRTVERALPYVKGTRDCAFGALGGAAMSSLRGNPAVGLVTGCAGALTPNLSPWRPLNAR